MAPNTSPECLGACVRESPSALAKARPGGGDVAKSLSMCRRNPSLGRGNQEDRRLAWPDRLLVRLIELGWNDSARGDEDQE